ncbi:serine hydrolase [Acinetobacter haemolyticus]|uniref:serine hydrolase n=2 Tax=Acinetobacter haemolyticus TaxID=29430 RepID=UPI002A6AE357|nr:serine hydrolase [Acinetobacter haemolyticus]WPO68331.1 serine hydrolase [Acinetobacter haemolyticus]
MSLKEFNNVCELVSEISAETYSIFVYDKGCKSIIAEKNIKKRIVPASLVKLLTFYMVFKLNLPLRRIVKIERKFLKKGSGNNLLENDILTINDLLKNMIFNSSNTSAEALRFLIEDAIENKFQDYVLKLLKELDMHNTTILNAHGLYDLGQYTIVPDFEKLMMKILDDVSMRSFLLYKHKNIILKRRGVNIEIETKRNDSFFLKTGTLYPNVFNSVQVVKMNNLYLIACLGFCKSQNSRLIDQEIVNIIAGDI